MSVHDNFQSVEFIDDPIVGFCGDSWITLTQLLADSVGMCENMENRFFQRNVWSEKEAEEMRIDVLRTLASEWRKW